MKNLARVLVAASVCASVMVVGPTSEATYPGTNGAIAFPGFGKGSLDIATMNPGGTARGLLFDDPKLHELSLSYSADGQKIALLAAKRSFSEYEIYSANADGSGITQLTDTDAFEGSPVFSPDGSTIAFVRNLNLWNMEADGSNPTKLTSGVEVDSGRIDFEPDGSSIVLATYGDDFSSHISIYDVVSDSVTIIKNSGPEGQYMYAPAYAPDGSKVAYIQGTNDGSEVRVMNPNGSGDVAVPLPYESVFSFDWAPQGNRLVVSFGDGKDVGIATVDVDGSDLTLLSADFASSLAWQPCAGACTVIGPREAAVWLFSNYKRKVQKYVVRTGTFPAFPDELISVTLKRKARGSSSFVKLGTKQGSMDDQGGFKAVFRNVPKSGTCKAVSKYAGSEANFPAKTTKTTRCKFGSNPIAH